MTLTSTVPLRSFSPTHLKLGPKGKGQLLVQTKYQNTKKYQKKYQEEKVTKRLKAVLVLDSRDRSLTVKVEH